MKTSHCSEAVWVDCWKVAQVPSSIQFSDNYLIARRKLFFTNGWVSAFRTYIVILRVLCGERVAEERTKREREKRRKVLFSSDTRT